MRTVLLMIAASTMLVACTEAQQVATDAATGPAKRVATQAIFTSFPQIPGELTADAADCVIANATPEEINALAGDAVTGIGEATSIRVQTILSRPETTECLLAAANTRGIEL